MASCEAPHAAARGVFFALYVGIALVLGGIRHVDRQMGAQVEAFLIRTGNCEVIGSERPPDEQISAK